MFAEHHAHTYARTHVRTHARTHTHAHTRTHTHTHTHTHARAHTHTHTHTHTHARTHTHTHTHTHSHARAHTHTHTHTRVRVCVRVFCSWRSKHRSLATLAAPPRSRAPPLQRTLGMLRNGLQALTLFDCLTVVPVYFSVVIVLQTTSSGPSPDRPRDPAHVETPRTAHRRPRALAPPRHASSCSGTSLWSTCRHAPPTATPRARPARALASACVVGDQESFSRSFRGSPSPTLPSFPSAW